MARTLRACSRAWVGVRVRVGISVGVGDRRRDRRLDRSAPILVSSGEIEVDNDESKEEHDREFFSGLYEASRRNQSEMARRARLSRETVRTYMRALEIGGGEDETR